MGVCQYKQLKKYPSSGLYEYNDEKERIVNNEVGSINFKDLFLDSLSPEFLKIFKKNINLFYSQYFLEGICYEYGLLDKSMNKNKAFQIYKEAADFKYDYLCMYRLHRIFLTDYKDFGLKKNRDLDRLYLYKCFAYLPFFIINGYYFLLNKINVTKEIAIILNTIEDGTFDVFDRFMDFLKNNKREFNLSTNDINLMKNVLKCCFRKKDDVKEDLDLFLEFEKGDKAYYEAQLKYCNFYLELFPEECDKENIKNIFENLINAEYYKASCDYGRFLINNDKQDEAKNIFKKGMDNSQQFCLSEYIYLILREINLNHLLSDYKIISYLLKNIILVICFEKLSLGSFFYGFYYLFKHSSFKKQIKNDFIKFVIEVYQNIEKNLQIENNEYVQNNFEEKYTIQIPSCFGQYCYYGIFDYINPDKEKALVYFKKAYKLAKEKEYIYLKRLNYLYIYKCRKYLFKNNKIISVRKLNKTKEKLFRMYDGSDEQDLNSIEFYNYYKLYKIGVIGNIQNKLISLLKSGKKLKIYYDFKVFIYKEKCKLALEKEYSNITSLNQNNIILKNENSDDKNKINIYFQTMEAGKKYKISVSKDLQFIKVVHKLFTIYPELEAKKIGTYVSNGRNIGLFDTVQENEIEENSVILIINKFS